MATVTSFTAEKIQQLLSGWAGIELSQEETLALIGQLYIQTQSQEAALTEFANVTLPQMYQALQENSAAVQELNASVLPELQDKLEQAAVDLESLNSVDLPGLRNDIDAEIVNGIERPKVYVQPDEPLDPDDDDRYLVVGDVWYDSDDNNLQRIWNGSVWTTFQVDIPDLSITVKKFKTASHLIY